MPVGGVVEYQIHDDADIPLSGFCDKLVHILHGAVHFIDLVIVGNVIAVVCLRRAVDRRQPDRPDAEGFEVVQFTGDTLQISDPVSVRILEALDIDFIGVGLLPPFECAGWFWRTLSSFLVTCAACRRECRSSSQQC